MIGEVARDFHAPPRSPASRYSKCPRCRRGAPSSREGTRSEVSWETSVSSVRAGTTGNISHAQSICRYLLPTWAVYYPFSSTARYQSYIFIVGVPHLSLASSLLSFLPAIVSHTSGSYVVVVGLSRFLSASSHHLCGTDFVSSFRKAVLRKGPQNIEEHRALNILKSRHGIGRPHSFASSSLGRSESLYSYKRHVYLFRNCSTKSS